MDERGFQQLAEPYLDELLGTARQLTGSAEAAEELLQECLTAAVAARSELRRPELAGAWLHQILRRKWYDELRRRYRERRALSQVAAADDARKADEDRVGIALDRLPADERRVLELKFFESRTSFEIASILGHPPGTVRSMIFRALQKFETAYRIAGQEEGP